MVRSNNKRQCFPPNLSSNNKNPLEFFVKMLFFDLHLSFDNIRKSALKNTPIGKKRQLRRNVLRLRKSTMPYKSNRLSSRFLEVWKNQNWNEFWNEAWHCFIKKISCERAYIL